MDCEGGFIEGFKQFARASPRLYRLLNFLISPVYISQKNLQRIIRTYFVNRVVVNVGCGPLTLEGNMINVDIKKYGNVHVVADALNLPFKDGSVDGVINIAVLEHLVGPHKAIDEMHRILKDGGHILSYIPFMQGYHSAPDDYYRWTINGIKEIYQDFETVELKVSGGPTSALLWMLIEWLSTAFSFGNTKIHDIVYIVSMSILWPIKFLDIILNRYPMSKNIASSFYYIGKRV